MRIEDRKQAANVLGALQEVLATADVGMIADDEARVVIATHHAVLTNLIECVGMLTGAGVILDADKCPRCSAPLNMERPALNALSRVDNSTYICSPCGNLEAIYDYSNPGKDLPPLNQRITLGA